MKKAAMIQHQVREPRPLPIKILTQFENIGIFQPKPEEVLAKLFLYTSNSVFEGVIKKEAINAQLTWNQNSINTINDCLNGNRTAIDIRFEQFKGHFALICEIESGIKVTLFEITMSEIPEVIPLEHMKKVFMNYKQIYSQQESKVKQEKDKITTELKQMQALGKRIEDQTQTQIIHMKKNFIEIINRCKKCLRKHMKTGICQIVEEVEDREEENKIKKRPIVRVNRQALQRQIMNQDFLFQENAEPEKNLESLFD